jgi:hypothetical protein
MADSPTQATETPADMLRQELRAAAQEVIGRIGSAFLDLMGQLKEQAEESNRSALASQEAYRKTMALHDENLVAMQRMSEGIKELAENSLRQAAEARVMHAESLKDVHMTLLRIEQKLDRMTGGGTGAALA